MLMHSTHHLLFNQKRDGPHWTCKQRALTQNYGGFCEQKNKSTWSQNGPLQKYHSNKIRELLSWGNFRPYQMRLHYWLLQQFYCCEAKPKFWVMAINGKLAMANLRFSAALLAKSSLPLQCFFDVLKILGRLE